MRKVSSNKIIMYRRTYFLVLIIFLCLFSSILADDSTSGSKLTIAVVDLDNMKGVEKEDVVVLSERLRNELYETGKYIVVERKQMEKLLSEQGFSLTGCVDNMCYVQAGRLLGVSLMVVGSVSKIEGMYSISARIVDVETAEYRNTATLDIDSDIRGLLTDGMKYIALKLAGDDPRMPESGRKPANKYSQTNHSDDDNDTYLYFSFSPGYTLYSNDTINRLVYNNNDQQTWTRYAPESGLTFNTALGISFKKLSIELGFCVNLPESEFLKEEYSEGMQISTSVSDRQMGIGALWLIGKYNLNTDHEFVPFVTFGPLVGGNLEKNLGFNLGAGFKIPVSRGISVNLEGNFIIMSGSEFGDNTIFNIKLAPDFAIKFF
jgi:TolB-like protein